MGFRKRVAAVVGTSIALVSASAAGDPPQFVPAPPVHEAGEVVASGKPEKRDASPLRAQIEALIATRSVEVDPYNQDRITRITLKDAPGTAYVFRHDVLGRLRRMEEWIEGSLARTRDLESSEQVLRGPGWETRYVFQESGQVATTHFSRFTDGVTSELEFSLPAVEAFSDLRCMPRRSAIDLERRADSVINNSFIDSASSDPNYLEIDGMNMLVDRSCGNEIGMTEFLLGLEDGIDTGLSCLDRLRRHNNMAGASHGFLMAGMIGYFEGQGVVRPLKVDCGRNLSASGWAFFCETHSGSPGMPARTPPSISLDIGKLDSTEKVASTFFHEMLHMTGIPHCDSNYIPDPMYSCPACCFGVERGAGGRTSAQVRKEACESCGAPPIWRTGPLRGGGSCFDLWNANARTARFIEATVGGSSRRRTQMAGSLACSGTELLTRREAWLGCDPRWRSHD